MRLGKVALIEMALNEQLFCDVHDVTRKKNEDEIGLKDEQLMVVQLRQQGRDPSRDGIVRYDQGILELTILMV